MRRIAVIGSGISGLATAYYLSRRHVVSLFEQENRIGGHTHTVTVDSSAGPLAIDTGFIVHNDHTYPHLIRLLRELNVPRVDSDMSFAVRCAATGYEYSSRGLNGFFAQRQNIFKTKPYRLYSELRRFNRAAPQLLERTDAASLTLRDFLDEGRYSADFREFYLYPMASAVWSCAPGAVDAFPAEMLVRFFANHNFLTTTNQHQWKTIPGGCGTYLSPISSPFRERIHLSAHIKSVARDEQSAILRFADGRPEQRFDDIVFATNCDRVLPLLENPSDLERDILQNFATSANDVTLHTDENLLPQRPAARASWNYLLHLDHAAQCPCSTSSAAKTPVTMTYHMNRLHNLQTRENYCVTLNANGTIRPDKILRRFVYHHPLYTVDSLRAQKRWAEISGVNRFHFAGAYWFCGFHEDGVNSALRVAKTLGVSVA